MGDVDLFGLRSKALQQGLNRPRLTVASGVPKQGRRLLGRALSQKRFVERLFEFEASASDALGIPGLAGLPAVGVARLKPGFRIAGLTGLEPTVC